MIITAVFIYQHNKHWWSKYECTDSEISPHLGQNTVEKGRFFNHQQ